MVDNAREEALAYIASKESKVDMETRLIRLKQEFYKVPGPATSEREKMLCSTQNIVFLYIEAKLLSAGQLIEHVIKSFDTENKGTIDR